MKLGHCSRNDAQHIICVFHPQVEQSRDRQFKSVVTVGDRTYSSSLWYNSIRTTTIIIILFLTGAWDGFITTLASFVSIQLHKIMQLSLLSPPATKALSSFYPLCLLVSSM